WSSDVCSSDLAGPNRGSAFHVVGGQFDTVYDEGAYRLGGPEEIGDGTGGSQVLPLVAAQGGFAELEFPEAGTYPFVSHAMDDAERGAHGVSAVSEWGAVAVVRRVRGPAGRRNLRVVVGTYSSAKRARMDRTRLWVC